MKKAQTLQMWLIWMMIIIIVLVIVIIFIARSGGTIMGIKLFS